MSWFNRFNPLIGANQDEEPIASENEEEASQSDSLISVSASQANNVTEGIYVEGQVSVIGGDGK